MVAVALSVFLAGATDADLYFRVQRSYDETAATLGPVVRGADRAIADYLVSGGGGLAELFNEREIAHMRDVYALFEDMRIIRIAAFSLGAALLFAAVIKNPRWTRALPVGGVLGAVLFFAPLIVIGIWAAVDFHGAFRAMHRLLFRNMLWLLDPGTDYLIRLLPQEFFERISAILAARCALASLIPPVSLIAGPLLYRKWTRR